MFTGIISELGSIEAVQETEGSLRVTVKALSAVAKASHGDSICVSGVCLTVINKNSDGSFVADVMGQTLKTTNRDQWVIGRRVNIESALAAGDALGGHIVQGHVDGTSKLISITQNGDWRVLRFSLDPNHAPLVVDKGSITVDGVSLTVSAVNDDWFEVSLIPETLQSTTLGTLSEGDSVNIETDILARHIRRLAHFENFTNGEQA